LNNNLAFERFLKKLNLSSSEILDIQDIFCDDYWCYSIRNNQILISDNNHPSVKGSQLINDKIIKLIKKLNFK
jgi:lysophospholipase L1-like esterase